MSTLGWKSRRYGFTLIEVMAAVAVLAILVVFMGRVFSESSKVWKLGGKRVESNNSGRAAIDFIASEISSAIINGKLELQRNENADTIYGTQSDRIAFMASSGTPSDVDDTYKYSRKYTARQIRQSAFAVIQTNSSGTGPYFLAYHNEFNPGAMYDAFSGTAWAQTLMNDTKADNSSVIAENVRNLKIYIYDQRGALITSNPYQSWQHGLPLFIDVYLEVLGQEDAIKASLGAINYPAMAHRYCTRVFMPNVQGYTRD